VTRAKYETHVSEKFTSFLTIKARNARTLFRDGNNGPTQAENYATFLQFSKKTSQIIAESWLSSGSQIQQALLSGTSEDIKRVFAAKGMNIDEFFHPFRVKVTVCWNCFFCNLMEEPNNSGTIILSIPYPPRPNGIEDSELQEWVNDNDREVHFPSIPYIPMPCC
jgi:hypothetical protein